MLKELANQGYEIMIDGFWGEFFLDSWDQVECYQEELEEGQIAFGGMDAKEKIAWFYEVIDDQYDE